MRDIKATPELSDLAVAFFTGTDDISPFPIWGSARATRIGLLTLPQRS